MAIKPFHTAAGKRDLANHYLELASAVDQMDLLPQMKECLNKTEYRYLEEALDYMMRYDDELV
jgi:hypothetical protein